MKTDILEQINEAKSSKSLSLNETEITDEIWQEITKLTHLEYLYIRRSDIGKIPDNIILLNNLNRLTIDKCNLSSFPIVLTKLTAIEDLDIDDNLIENLPDEFKNFKELKDLDISGNPIKKIPDILSQLPKLNDLDLSKTQIIDYSSLGLLTNLTRLNLSNCQLSSLPNEVGLLTNLERINLRQNRLTEFPSQLLSLIKITDIDLDTNNIKEFPNEISNLKLLNNIDLDDNNLEEIPKGIGKIENLLHLNLRNNNITSISPEIFKLKKLQRLRFGRNQITTIPPQISNLQNLRDLDIDDNPINALKFGYIISDKEHDFRYKFHRFRHEKDEINIFNFDEANIETSYGDNYIFLKSDNNYGFIELIDHPEKLEMRREFRKRDFYESFRYGSGFLIYILGDTEKQKTFLNKITIQINKWIKKQEIEFDVNRKGHRKNKFAFRFFYYPIPEKHERETVIDYDKLLKYKEAGENLYFDDEWGRKLSVTDLLTYIGAEDVKIEKVWNGTDYITNVQIENFKLLKNIQFNISERINIVLGRNALGKTSILQAITLGLLPLDNVDKSNEFESFISFGQAQSEIIINWGEEYRKAYIFKNELNEEKHIDFPQKLLLAYGVNLNTEIKLDHSKIIEHLISGKAIPYSTKSIFKDYSTDFYDPLILLEKLQIENSKKNDKLIASIINLIAKTINNYLSLIEEKERILLEQKNTDFFFIDINNNKLKTQHLSEGYKDHILLITDIITRIISSRNNIFDKTPSVNKLFVECKGVILIDEFDRHLHPVWQRRLLLQLKTDFPQIQFILTTHNLFSLQSAEGFNSLILGIKDGEITITEKPIKSGLSIKSIYNMYFDGNNKFFGYETEELFTKFYELIVKIKKQEVSKTELKQFRNIINQLLDKDEEVQVIISRELRQLERQTGKTFEL